MNEFNRQVYRVSRAMLDEVDAVAKGMDIAALCNDAKETAIKYERTLEILALPLCASCRAMIGGGTKTERES